MNVGERLSACRRVRRAAAAALAHAITQHWHLAAPITERALADTWLTQMRTDSSIHPEGWYVPPLHGIGVLIARDDRPGRLTHPTLRTVIPDTAAALDVRRGLVYAYASPVDRATGVIGDFGVTLYFGDDPRLRQHLANALEVDRLIFEQAQVGSRFCELAAFGHARMLERGISSALQSSTDPVGDNMGHTIPGIHDPWTHHDPPLSASARWQDVCEAISRRRRFVNLDEPFRVGPGMAFTIEPRPVGEDLPMVSFHTIAAMHEDGSKEWLTDYEDLFALTGMNSWITAGRSTPGSGPAATPAALSNKLDVRRQGPDVIEKVHVDE